MINNSAYDNRLIPSAEHVYKHKSFLKAKTSLESVDLAESRESLTSFVESIDSDEKENECKCFVAQDFVTISSFMTIIPFTCFFLLNEAACLLGSENYVRVVLDLTHDIFQEKFKLGLLSFAAYHFVRGFWRSTVISVVSCSSSNENTSIFAFTGRDLRRIYERVFDGSL